MKYIPLTFLVLLLVGNTAQASVFTKDLSFGVRGDSEVSQLQEFLASEGLYSGPITGNFFSLTLKAVKAFQTREGIEPSAGYFGPVTRMKANEQVGVEASDNQALGEVGVVPTVTNEPTALQQQIDALLQQVALLQSQIQEQKSTNTTLEEIKAQLNVIKTAPVPTEAPLVVSEPVKSILEDHSCREDNEARVYCNVYVYYLEDGKMTPDARVIVTADDNGTFSADGKGNTNTMLTRFGGFPQPAVKGPVAGAFFQYIPEAKGARAILVTAGGVSKTITVQGQK